MSQRLEGYGYGFIMQAPFTGVYAGVSVLKEQSTPTRKSVCDAWEQAGKELPNLSPLNMTHYCRVEGHGERLRAPRYQGTGLWPPSVHSDVAF